MATSGYKRRGFNTQRAYSASYKSKFPVSGTAYQNITNTFKTKVNSYQTLIRQAQGTGYNAPTPAALNTLARWVDKGAVIQTVTNTQLKRWARTNKTYTSATSAKSVLWNKFGKTPIKAVYHGKGNNFIVATSPTWKGKTFKFPS